MTKNCLDVEYKIYDESTRALLIVRESPDCPGITELVMQEETDRKDHKYGTHITINDDDLPLLIEALQRRLKDAESRDDS
jgi:hypothetical protein